MLQAKLRPQASRECSLSEQINWRYLGLDSQWDLINSSLIIRGANDYASGVEDERRKTNECVESCPPACLQWEMKKDENFADRNDNAGIMSIEVRIITFESLHFEQFLEMPFEVFVGTFGGVLGTWLGLDLVSVFTHLLALRDFVRREWRKKFPHRLT